MDGVAIALYLKPAAYSYPLPRPYLLQCNKYLEALPHAPKQGQFCLSDYQEQIDALHMETTAQR